MNEPDSLAIYFDGHCPLCLAEIHLLAARNRRNLLYFVDINDDRFTTEENAVSCADAMAAIRGRLGNGQLLTGVSVFGEAYRRVDLPLLAWLLSRNWLRPVFDLGYHWFARNRHSISRIIGPPLLRLADWCISQRKKPLTAPR